MAIRNASPAGGTSTANPFGGTPASATTALARSYRVELPNGAIVNVGSQAEVDALQAAYSPMTTTRIGVPTGATGGSSTATFVEAAGDALETVGSFLAGRNYGAQLQDYQDAQDALIAARNKLQTLLDTGGASINPQVLQAQIDGMNAQIDANDAAVRVLNTQITAVDIAAGGAGARLVGRFLNSSGGGGAGIGTAAAVGLGGLGLGLLLTSNNNTSSSSRRRR